jgi:predicted HAD superfamily Cof-like phosphohydrolase
MISITEMLDEFHTRPGIDIGAPDGPTLDVPGLYQRQGFLEEEVRELREALEAHDLNGTAWLTGIPLLEVVAEIHASNMTKTAAPGDGKAIKGPNYQRPDVAGVLQRARRG